MKKKKKSSRKKAKPLVVDKDLTAALSDLGLIARKWCGYQPMQSARKK